MIDPASTGEGHGGSTKRRDLRVPAFLPSTLSASLELVVECRQIGCEPRNEAALGHLVREIDGAGKAQGVSPPVTLDRDAIEAEKRAAVGPARVHFLLENAETAGGENGAEFRQP